MFYVLYPFVTYLLTLPRKQNRNERKIMRCVMILTVEDVLLRCDLLEMAVELLLTGLTGARLLFGRRGPCGCDQRVSSRLGTGLCHHRDADTQLLQRLPENWTGYSTHSLSMFPTDHATVCCGQPPYTLFYLQFIRRPRQQHSAE